MKVIRCYPALADSKCTQCDQPAKVWMIVYSVTSKGPMAEQQKPMFTVKFCLDHANIFEKEFKDAKKLPNIEKG